MKDFLFEFYFYKTLINTNDEVKKINQFSKKNNNIALFSVHPTNVLQSYQSQKPYSFVRVPLLKESAGTH